MTELNLTDHLDLPEQLRIEFQPGRIMLGKHRMVLLHTSAMASLRKELVDTLGVKRARGILTRMGFESGKKDAELARQLLPNASDEDLFKIGPGLHSIEGVVKVTPLKFSIDISKGLYSGDFLWEDSYEAEIHLESFGTETIPVCWTQIGYATGYTSEIMGRFILYREVECCGKGDKRCRDVGKPLEDWQDSAEDMKYFEADHVADQLMNLQSEVENLRLSLKPNAAIKGMIGKTEAFLKSCELLKKAANSEVSVLILGETGVGKELFAHELHSFSPRSNKNFVSVNCATIPDDLIESELFGVEKGAYTGAQKSRPGRFERAHGGTLFLDEVGELTATAQAKLLRVLQEGEFERLGDVRTRKVDIRLVAATNVDLQDAVEKGNFRADLFYRLNIYPIVIPSLRQRRDDIPLFVDHFLEKFIALYGKKIAGILDVAMRALTEYSWPGNVRELEHIIERGVIITNKNESITLEDLFPRLNINESSEDPTSHKNEASSGVDINESELTDRLMLKPNPLEYIESALLKRAVDQGNGNLSAAARQLGITRPQLAYRLKKISAND